MKSVKPVLRLFPVRRGPRGPCGLKFVRYMSCFDRLCRGPRGPCGLKSVSALACLMWLRSRPARALWIEIPFMHKEEIMIDKSRPARALWIEMSGIMFLRNPLRRRGPRGPCGLKSLWPPVLCQHGSRGPRGPCGLKLQRMGKCKRLPESRPARALWIEIGF